MNAHSECLSPNRIVTEFPVTVALRNKNNQILCGTRYFDDIMHKQMMLQPKNIAESWHDAERGYVDQFGKFKTREQAILMDGFYEDSEFIHSSQERIVCSALLRIEGYIVCGPRHFDMTMREQLFLQLEEWQSGWRGAASGFVNQHGHFRTRQEAAIIAKAANQIRFQLPCGDLKLWSEHLY